MPARDLSLTRAPTESLTGWFSTFSELTSAEQEAALRMAVEALARLGDGTWLIRAGKKPGSRWEAEELQARQDYARHVLGRMLGLHPAWCHPISPAWELPEHVNP
jgi:hypothetical protein